MDLNGAMRVSPILARSAYLQRREVNIVEVQFRFACGRVRERLDDRLQWLLNLLQVRVHVDHRRGVALDTKALSMHAFNPQSNLLFSEERENGDDKALIDLHGELLHE